MDVFESILISGLSWWQINSSNSKRLLCMLSTLSLPVNGDMMRGEGASMVVPAGRPKLTHYLPSIRPSRFTTLGPQHAYVCVYVYFCVPSPCWVYHPDNWGEIPLKTSLADHLHVIGQTISISLSVTLSLRAYVCLFSEMCYAVLYRVCLTNKLQTHLRLPGTVV